MGDTFDCAPEELRSLETYRDALPYKTESQEEMLAKFEEVRAKLVVCASVKSWDKVHEWTAVLKWFVYPIARQIRCGCHYFTSIYAHTFQYSWMVLKHPMPLHIRAALAAFYYELICALKPIVEQYHNLGLTRVTVRPGLEERYIRSWTDCLGRLLRTKAGRKPRLSLDDLQLEWKPLWVLVKTEMKSPASHALARG